MTANFRHCLRVLPLTQSTVARHAVFSTSCLKSTNVQQGFEGLQAGFLWDHKHGFGYTKDGKVVIVTPQEAANVTAPTGVEGEDTESILEMAKTTYKQNAPTEQKPEQNTP